MLQADRRHGFYERLLDAAQAASEWCLPPRRPPSPPCAPPRRAPSVTRGERRCDAAGGRARALLSTLALLVVLVEGYAGGSAGTSSVTAGLARGLAATRDLLYRRLVEAETARAATRGCPPPPSRPPY